MWYNYVFGFGLFIMLMIVVSYFVANYFAKKIYQSDFANLTTDVSFAFVNYDNYKLIRQKFEDIYRFKCRNIEKLIELNKTFEDRFAVLFTPDEDIEEHSPDTFDFQDLQRQTNIHKILSTNENDEE